MSRFDSEQFPQLDAQLDVLLTQSPEARAAHLAQLDQSNPSLADALRSFLDSADRARESHFLTGAVGPELTAQSRQGERFGAYVLEQQVGVGGFGSVWRAHRADGQFEGQVAIKLLHPSLQNQAITARFRREGAILSRLAHPNIAHLMDAGISEQGQHYLVLQYVDGLRIDRYCDQHRLSIIRRLELFTQVLEAVAYAHRHLVVHRDIKPSNVLVTKEGQLQLLDFGIAKLLAADTEATDSAALTRDATQWMTPDYAAPEQIQGKSITTTTDIYSLGVLLFELLLGTRPRRNPLDNDSEAETLSQAIARLERAADRPLIAIAATRMTSTNQLRRAIKGDLENILMHALAREPTDRYSSVDAFRDDLSRFLTNQPIAARPPALSDRIIKFVRRNRAAVAVSALLALAVIAGVFGTISQARVAEANALVAQKERDRALDELVKAEAINELIRFLMSEGSETPMTPSELLTRAETMIERQFADEPALRARLSHTIAQEFANLDELEKSEKTLSRTIQAASTIDDPELHANIKCFQSALARKLGRLEEGLKLVNEGLALIQDHEGFDNSLHAYCVSKRSVINLDLGNAEAALADAQASLKILGTPRPGQRLDLLQLRAVLADAQGRLGTYPQAIANYQWALDELKALGRERTTLAGALENNYAVTLMNAGVILPAVELLESSRSIREDLAGPEGFNPLANSNLAGVYLLLGRSAEAIELLEAALAYGYRTDNARVIGIVGAKLASALCKAGKADACAQRLDEGESAFKTMLPPEHAVFGSIGLIRAELALLRGQDDAARQYLEQSLGIFDAADEVNPNSFVARSRLAALEQRRGQADRAKEYSAQSTADARRYVGAMPASEWVGSALLTQAEIALAQGDRAQALVFAQESLQQLTATLGPDAPATQQASSLAQSLTATPSH